LVTHIVFSIELGCDYQNNASADLEFVSLIGTACSLPRRAPHDAKIVTKTLLFEKHDSVIK
jgi:hypothetical protein